jgi:putative membrane protein
MELLLIWVITAFAFIVAAKLIRGVHIQSVGSAFLVAAVYGLFSVLISWLLWTVLTIGTLGLALVLGFITKFIVAAIVIKLVDLAMTSLRVDGFVNAILAALVVAGVTTLGEWLLETAGIAAF